MDNKKLEKYNKHYTEEKFWNKLKFFAKKAGKELLERALRLYYCAKDEKTPLWVKNVIFGALGYFILPLDLVPDILPIVGFADDLSVLGMALTAASAYIQQEHIDKAEETIKKWFN